MNAIYFLIIILFALLIFFILCFYLKHYNKKLNECFRNKTKNNLKEPHKLYKLSVLVMLPLILLFATLGIKDLVNDKVPITIKKDIISLNNLSEDTNKDIDLLNYPVYDKKELNNSISFKVTNKESFDIYIKNLSTYVSEEKTKEEIRYVLYKDKNYYEISYDFVSKEYSISQSSIMIIYETNEIDYIPSLPLLKKIQISSKDKEGIYKFNSEYSWVELKDFYLSLNMKGISIEENEKRIIINNDIFMSEYIIKCSNGELEIVIVNMRKKISFDLQGGKWNNQNNIFTLLDIDCYNNPPIPEKANAVFLGWYRSLSDDELAYDFSSKVYNDFVLYAKWDEQEVLEYTITYDANCEGIDNYIFKTKSNYFAELYKITRFGYNLVGWYTDLNDPTTKVTLETKITQDLYLYAKWEEKNKYTVTFDPLDGVIVKDNSKSASIEVYEGNFPRNSQPGAKLKEGYSFVGWYLDETFENLLTEWTYIDKDITVYAKYTINMYRLQFDTNGGEEIDSIYLYYQDEIKLDIVPVRLGYKFIAWETEYNIMPASDIVVTAKWEKIDMDGFDFVINDSKDGFIMSKFTMDLSEYENKECLIKVPSSFCELPVVEIGEKAFYENTYITEIELPDSIQKISYMSFALCVNLEKINFPDSLKEIEKSAFASCKLQKELLIPSTIEILGESAFINTKIEKVIVDASITKLPKYLFANCSELKEVKLNENIRLVNSCCFKNCDSLDNLDFLSNVKEIGYEAFINCDALVDISIPEGVEILNEKAFYECVNLKSVIISDTVKTIGKETFSSDISLEKVVMGNSLEILEEKMFAYCTSLKEVKLPDNLKEIKKYAFLKCASLVELVLPEKLERIKKYAFVDCDSLKYINIPDSVIEIEEYIFSDKNNIEFTSDDTYVYLDNWIFDLVDYHKDLYTIDSNIRGIYRRAFQACKGKTIIIPKNVIYVGEYAFWSSDADIYIQSTIESNYDNWHESWKTAQNGAIYYDRLP